LKLLIIVTIIVTVIFGTSIIPSSDANQMDRYNVEYCDREQIICIDDKGGECNEIGNWNQNSKTCKLTEDVETYLWIMSSGITLNGNGHHSSIPDGRPLAYGPEYTIYDSISIVGNDVTIKNITVDGWSKYSPGDSPSNKGILCLRDVSGTTIADSKFYRNHKGVNCNNSLIENNDFLKNGYAIYHISNSIIQNNHFVDDHNTIQLIDDNIVENNIFEQNEYREIVSDGTRNTIAYNYFGDSPTNLDTIKPGGKYDTIHDNYFMELPRNEFTFGHLPYHENYWDDFNSINDGCVVIESSNFCQNPLKTNDDREKIIDPKPWRIQYGWLYDITVPADMDAKTDSSDGKTISYHVTGSGPDGIMPVTCNYASGSTFPIGTTEVICSLENGFVSSFLVTIMNDISEQVVEEPVAAPQESSEEGGGCLIATATYGSEMAPQVQQLRELRDNQLLQTESGKQFMGMFNDVYYSFSPIIADMEREHPVFKQAVKLAITPMISSLSLMENAESESEVLGIGIYVIALNIGMYLGVPAVVVIGIRKRF
jgi:hypothetical protein